MYINRHVPDLPERHWAVIEPFVTAAVTEAAPQTKYQIRVLLTDVARHTYWCWQTCGLPLDRSVIFHRDVIEEYARVGCPALSRTSAGNRRTKLLRVAEALLVGGDRVTRLSPLCDPSPSMPYNLADTIHLRSWAQGQITPRRRRDCATLLALGLGGGLSAAEMKVLRIRDITVDDAGVLISVTGDRSRTVPVLGAWEKHLADLPRSLPSNSLAFGTGRPNPTSRNAVSNFVARTAGVGLKPNSHRMRATWIVNHLTWGTPLVPLMEAAGLFTLEVMDRYMCFVPGVIDVEHARSLLRHQLNSQEPPARDSNTAG